MAVVFFMTRFQKQSVLFRYEISMTVGFAGFRDFKDGRYCFVTSFQWRSVLVGYEISKTVGIVSLRVFNGSRFWFVARSQ